MRGEKTIQKLSVVGLSNANIFCPVAMHKIGIVRPASLASPRQQYGLLKMPGVKYKKVCGAVMLRRISSRECPEKLL